MKLPLISFIQDLKNETNNLKYDYLKNWKGVFLWSNHFYGLCATLLSIETVLALLHQFPSLDTICVIYLSTVLYYTHAYLNETKQGVYNERTEWYQKHKKYFQIRQLILTIILLYIFFFRLNFIELWVDVDYIVLGILFFSFLISILYYFPIHSRSTIAIRLVGLIKSVSIAWVWCITCCLAPILLTERVTHHIHILTPHFILYFFQLFIFIFILTILFDIKDMARDEEEVVNTIVLKYGISTTIRTLITPLALLYLILSFRIIDTLHQSTIYLWAQFILILILYVVITIIQKIRQIHVNILLIDGLMLLKAIIGILAATK